MANDPSTSLLQLSALRAIHDLDLDMDPLPPASHFSDLDHRNRLFPPSSSSQSAHVDFSRSGSVLSPSPSQNVFHVDLSGSPGFCRDHFPLPPREDLESVLDVLKPPSHEDLVWLDSLTPVSATTTDTSTEELLDLVTPVSTPSSTPADETKVHMWPFSGFQPVAADTQDSGAQYLSSDTPQTEIPAKKYARINNRKHLPPLSPKAVSPLSDASVRSTDRRKKEYGTSVPFNFKASTKDEAMYDGYRWQKYCKKTIKESPYPRFYFKCATKHCTARKQVQHCPTDPKVVFTTYEAPHNHDPPPSLPVGVIVSGGACMCQSSRVLPCLNCLGKGAETRESQPIQGRKSF